MNAVSTNTREQEYFSMAAICDMVCIDLDVNASHYFQKFLAWGMWGLVQLKMDTANCVKPVILPVSDVLTAVLPADCVDVVKIALMHGQYVKEFVGEEIKQPEFKELPFDVRREILQQLLTQARSLAKVDLADKYGTSMENVESTPLNIQRMPERLRK